MHPCTLQNSAAHPCILHNSSSQSGTLNESTAHPCRSHGSTAHPCILANSTSQSCELQDSTAQLNESYEGTAQLYVLQDCPALWYDPYISTAHPYILEAELHCAAVQTVRIYCARLCTALCICTSPISLLHSFMYCTIVLSGSMYHKSRLRTPTFIRSLLCRLTYQTCLLCIPLFCII